MRITTKHTSNVNGRGQVIARSGGKQRTVSWDHGKSADWNHGAAAGTLLREAFGVHLWHPDTIDAMFLHMVHEDHGDRHTFTVPPMSL